MRLLGSENGHVHAHAKRLIDGVRDADILKDVHRKLRRDLDHDGDVAVRAIIAPRPRAEQGGMTRPSPSQSALVMPEPVQNVPLVHGRAIEPVNE